MMKRMFTNPSLHVYFLVSCTSLNNIHGFITTPFYVLLRSIYMYHVKSTQECLFNLDSGAMINLTASRKFKVHEINTMRIFSILTLKNIPVYYKVHTCLLGIMRAHVRFLHHAIFSKWIAMTISAYDEEFSQCRIIQKFFEYIKVF